MDFSQYNKESSRVLLYPKLLGGVDISPMYLGMGVCGEAGETVEKIKKVYRDSKGVFDNQAVLEIKKEIGDVLWYLNRLSEELGFTLESAAELNILKLQDRIEREKLKGEGDNR